MSHINIQQPGPMEYQPAPQNFNTVSQPPPPYYGQTPSVQQQSSSNVVVVQSQPTPAVVCTVRPVGDNFLTLSIILTIICLVCGTWCGLLCTIPAIIFSTMARDAEERGDYETAKTHGRISLGLNIGSIVSWVVFGVAAVITFAVIIASAGSNDCSSYYDYYYDNYRYRC